MLKLAIIGPGRSGKGEASAWLARNTRLRYSFSTSRVIVDAVAPDLGLAPDELYRRRHEFRELLRRKGDEMRADDPAFLARATLADGDICDGIRSRVEIEAVVRKRLVGLVLWVKRDVPPDSTLEYDPLEFCDVVIPNDGPITDLHTRLRRLANALGILRTS